ncbi:hypothetical protein D3C85_1810560 [compost metagenome]
MVDRQESRKPELELFLKQTMEEHGIPARTCWLPPSSSGVAVEQIETNQMQNRSFLDMIKGEKQL